MSLAYDAHLSHGDGAPCIQIRKLVSGLNPNDRQLRWPVILDAEPFQAVLDESGYGACDDDAPRDVFVFAGYIAKVHDWETFAHRWRAIIAEHPELDDVKTVKGLFRWEGRDSDVRAFRLMNAVAGDPHFGSIRWRLPYRDYRSVVLTNILGGRENLYYFAWMSVLFNILGSIHRIPHATVDIFYDQNIEQEPKLQEGYELFRKSMGVRFPKTLAMLPRRPTARSDTDFWPIRAADALAWSTHRTFWRAERNRSFSNPLSRLLDSGTVASNVTFGANDVREILNPTQMTKELIEKMSKEEKR